MAFHEVRFPVGISRSATGGPMRRTDVVTLRSGYEERNALWADSRRRYNAGYGAKSLDDLHAILAFFEARNGRLHGFRWRDWADWKSCPPLSTPTAIDQGIGTGDGVTAAFQMSKAYSDSGGSWARTINKPVTGTIRVAVAGVEKTIATHWTVDLTSGVVTFTAGNIPTAGQAVTAGYEFDVPVRFDTDELVIDHEQYRLGRVPDVPLVEIRV